MQIRGQQAQQIYNQFVQSLCHNQYLFVQDTSPAHPLKTPTPNPSPTTPSAVTADNPLLALAQLLLRQLNPRMHLPLLTLSVDTPQALPTRTSWQRTLACPARSHVVTPVVGGIPCRSLRVRCLTF